jgi:hypothetical protein
VPVHTNDGSVMIGIDEMQNEIASSVYPNPMNHEAHLVFSNPNHKPYFFSMKDITGRIVFEEQEITTGDLLIERSSLSSGMYFYTLKNTEGKTGKGKIVVE